LQRIKLLLPFYNTFGYFLCLLVTYHFRNFGTKVCAVAFIALFNQILIINSYLKHRSAHLNVVHSVFKQDMWFADLH